jgi:hypothetical protein
LAWFFAPSCPGPPEYRNTPEKAGRAVFHAHPLLHVEQLEQKVDLRPAFLHSVGTAVVPKVGSDHAPDVEARPVRQQDEFGGVKPTSHRAAGDIFGQPGG